MTRQRRKRIAARGARVALERRIVAALIADAALLRLRWATLRADIRARFGCSLALADEALTDAVAWRDALA